MTYYVAWGTVLRDAVCVEKCYSEEGRELPVAGKPLPVSAVQMSLHPL